MSAVIAYFGLMVVLTIFALGTYFTFRAIKLI